MFARWRPVEYDWTCVSFDLPESTTQMVNRSVRPFLHSSWQSVVGYVGATWRIRLDSCFLRSNRVHNPNSKSIDSAVSAQLMAESPYTLQWVTLSPRIAPSHGGIWTPSNTWFPRPIRSHNPKGISTGSAVFAQMTAECPYTLQWDAPFPLKIAPFHGGIWTPSNTWFSKPTWVLNPSSISIGSAVFAVLTSVTDRQTDRPSYSLGNNRPHLRT